MFVLQSLESAAALEGWWYVYWWVSDIVQVCPYYLYQGWGSIIARGTINNHYCCLRRPHLAEGHTFLWDSKPVSIYILSSNIYYKLDEISDLKIFLNTSAGKWKRCGGPYLARGPLFAHPWSVCTVFGTMFINIVNPYLNYGKFVMRCIRCIVQI